MLPIQEIINKIEGQEKTVFDGKYYLALVVNDQTVQGGIWGVVEKKGKLFSCGSLEGWSGESAEELIVAADASIATAVSKMPEISGKQPTDVLLGLPEQWVKGDGLKVEKSKILKSVCKKLLLTPLGFIITPEAISYLIKDEEGGSPDLILLGVEEIEIAVSLISRGKFLGSKIVGRSDSIALDLEEGLLRFDLQDDLPNRILLTGSGDLESARQSLVAYPWINASGEKKLSFLQLPKIDLALDNLEITAVVYGGSKDLLKSDNPPELKFQASEKIQTEVEEIEKENISVEQPEKPTEELFTEDFGFIKEEDIGQKQISHEDTKPDSNQEEKVVTVVDDKRPQIISEEPVKPKKIFNIKAWFRRKKTTSLDRGEFTQPTVGDVYSLKTRKNVGTLFKKLFLNKFVIWLLIIILVTAGVFGLCMIKVVRADVKLLLNPVLVEKSFDFTVSIKASVLDTEKMILPAKEVTVEVSGEENAPINGKKIIGDKAAGEVIIYNRTDQQKIIPKGHVIVGPSNLRFIINEEIKIASKTANLEQGIDQWGETRAPVQAVNIGPQYNLEANSNLTLENLSSSSLVVKNPTAFTGGTSREIQAVSKEDKDNLQKLLTERLTGQATTEINGKIGSKDHLLSNGLLIKSQTSHFNREVGDEASDISLQQNISFSALYFNEDDAVKLAEKQTFNPPDGYNQESFKQENNFSLKDKGKNLYTAKIVKYYYPSVFETQIADSLKRKTFSQAENYLKSVSAVEGYKIIITPAIFARLKLLPFTQNNIKVELVSFE